MTAEYYPCYYHPEIASITVCQRCNRHICLTDKKVYRKKHGVFRSIHVTYTNYDYCTQCIASQYQSDLRHQFKNLIIIPMLFVLFVYLVLEFPNIIFKSSKNEITFLIFFIGFPLIIIGGIVNAYLKVKKAELEVLDLKKVSSSLISDVDKNVYCVYHPHKFSTSICKNCKKSICADDIKKYGNRKDDYCINCYISLMKKRLNPFIFFGIAGIYEMFIIILAYSSNVFNKSAFYQDFFLISGILVPVIFFIFYKIGRNKIKKAEEKVLSYMSSLNPSNNSSQTYFSTCAECGADLGLHDQFCPNCGYSISKN